MQKFGLERNGSGGHTAIELEIAREQASSLGRAGRKLRLCLESYQSNLSQNMNLDQKNEYLNEIAKNVWELVLQREFVGFVEGNLKWVTQNYIIPKEVINMLGAQPGHQK